MSEELSAPETGAEEPAVAPEETAAPQAEAPEQQPEAEAEPQEDKKPDRVAKRFSELSGQRDAARQEAEYWRQQALARANETAPAQEDEPENPHISDAIQAAVQRALNEERQKAAFIETQNAQAEKARSLVAKLYESGLEGAVLIASGADIPFSQPMIDALSVSEHAAAVAHHLGTNPQDAARIAALAPQLQGYELAKLESRLASQPKTTSAPPPPPTVGARANPAQGLRDDMSPEDWRKAFVAEMRSR